MAKVILTGTCSAGKTCVFDNLNIKGYQKCPEVARRWLNFIEAQKLSHYMERNFFQQLIEIHHIHNWTGYDKTDDVIFDRSLPDEIAYRKHFNMKVPKTLIQDCLRYKADKVFIFPFWKEIFKNDEVRTETEEQAQEIDELITSAYIDLGYDVIIMPKVGIEERIEFITSHLN